MKLTVGDRTSDEDRKVDWIVREIKWYSVKVVDLQETKWFGNVVYDVSAAIYSADVWKEDTKCG